MAIAYIIFRFASPQHCNNKLFILTGCLHKYCRMTFSLYDDDDDDNLILLAPTCLIQQFFYVRLNFMETLRQSTNTYMQNSFILSHAEKGKYAM